MRIQMITIRISYTGGSEAQEHSEGRQRRSTTVRDDYWVVSSSAPCAVLLLDFLWEGEPDKPTLDAGLERGPDS